MILVMSRSIAQGQKAGIMTAFGVSIGLLGHTFTSLTFFIKAPIGFISGLLSFWIKTRPIILIGLGFKLALEERN